MDASLPPIQKPSLTPDEKQGLQDYWNVYEAHREEVTSQLLVMASQHPEFKYILQNAAAQPTPEQQSQSREFQRNAIFHDDWEPYLRNLQHQGMQYARSGLSFHAWYEIFGAVRKYMVPYLLDAFGASPQRLVSAIHGMDALLDTAMSIIGGAYLENKEQLIRAQEEAVQEAVRRAQSEKRFRGLLEAAPDGMVIVDQEGTIVMVNAQMERLFGYNRNEVIGMRVELLVPVRFKDIHPFHRAQYAKSSRLRPMGADLELYA